MHKFIVSTVIILFFGIGLCLAAEEITITTYYPSPYGVYNDMVVMNNLGIGTTAPGGGTTTGTKILSIADGTDPVGGVSGQVSLYSSLGELYALDSQGNATLNSPHDKETGEWIFYSKNTKTGRVVRVNMEQLVKAVEEVTGKKFMFETFEQPAS